MCLWRVSFLTTQIHTQADFNISHSTIITKKGNAILLFFFLVFLTLNDGGILFIYLLDKTRYRKYKNERLLFYADNEEQLFMDDKH